MKKFAKHLTLFALMVGSFFIVAEYIIEKNAYKNDCIAWMGMQIDERADSIETLFVGSSLTVGLADSIWGQEAFNLGITAGSIQYEYYIADAVIPRLNSLKLLLLELSYHTLRDDRDYIENYVSCVGWWRPTIYFHTHKYSRWSTFGFEMFDAQMFREKLFGQFHGGGKEDPLRDLTLKETFNDEQNRIKAAEHTASCFSHDEPTYYQCNLRFLEGIIRMAQERGVEVVLFSPPMTDYYRQRMLAEQLEEMYSTATMLQHKYGIRFYDYMADSRFTMEDFLDINHINHGVGAKKFTRILKHDVLAGQMFPLLSNSNAELQ